MRVRNFAVAILLVAAAAAAEKPVLWRDPGEIASRDLFYGSGGKQHLPRAPFRFVEEDLGGSSPKFWVFDANGMKWKVKFGAEARPETAASRIVWAAGYFSDDDYLVPILRVAGMPGRLHRGHKFIAPDGSILNARLKREPAGVKKNGFWDWDDNPFAGTVQFNGLRTLMALLNNWDLKDENTAIREENGKALYLVSDLGASFGSAGEIWPLDKAKGNLEAFEKSKFLRRVTDDFVDFRAPARPRFVFLVTPKEYLHRVRMEKIGHRIPRGDARWAGRLLSRLSQDQIHEVFRAAGYSPAEIEEFSRVLESRIAVLNDL